MKFVFKAKTKEGDLKEGTIEAASRENANQILQKNGLFPISVISEEADSNLMKSLTKYYDKVTPKELVIFFRQLSILVEARVPIIMALGTIKSQVTNAYLATILQEIINDVQNGMSLGVAMAKHPEVFPPLTTNLIRAGEASGNLKKSIDYVADNLEKNYLLSSRIKGALTYPAIIMVTFAVVGFFVISFIIPKLVDIISSLNAKLPWYTLFVINVGTFMGQYWWAIGLIILALVGMAYYYLNTPQGQKEMDYWKIHLPIIGPLFEQVYITRFSENLSALLEGGIPILRALKITATVMDNSVYEALINRAAEEVKIGGTMSSVFAQTNLFPPLATQMIKIGEESGQIDTVLKHVATFYNQETEIATRNLSTLLEPIIMVIIGIAVGILAFSVLMPIYSIVNYM